jgi:hypothetical protein
LAITLSLLSDSAWQRCVVAPGSRKKNAATNYKVIGTTLNIAYTEGGATLVEQRIDQLVADRKITSRSSGSAESPAQKSYDALQAKLAELAVRDATVENHRITPSPAIAHKRPLPASYFFTASGRFSRTSASANVGPLVRKHGHNFYPLAACGRPISFPDPSARESNCNPFGINDLISYYFT